MPLLNSFVRAPAPKIDTDNSPRWDNPPSYGYQTKSNEPVSVFTSQSIATAYRAKNIISDAVAMMPFKMYRKTGRNIQSVEPDAVTRNMPYLMQISPNAWGWSPFYMKKAFVDWLLFYGNAYQWKPPVSPAQTFVLPANRTKPVFDLDGNLWYETKFSSSNKPSYIPSVEIMHLMINPDETGTMGRGVLTFARETFGRRLAGNTVQSKAYSQGFMPAAYVKLDGEAKKEHRDAVRNAYEESMSGSENAYRLAIFDNKITEFQPINIQLKDAQFLESIDATDRDICNWFGIPEHMLNRGKEAYNSNEEKYEEFVALTLDPFLVPWEEAARIRFIPEAEQTSDYFKFKREALYRMKAKERAELNSIKIQSGQMKPNEARAMEELDPYDLGDQFYMASNIQPIGTVSAQEEDA